MLVKYVMQMPAAASKPSFFGAGMTNGALATTRSASVRPHAATTRSPGATCVTPSPTAATTPDISVPTTNGSGGRSWYRPWIISRSGKLSAAAFTSTSTSPGPACGSGQSFTYSSPPTPVSSRQITARIECSSSASHQVTPELAEAPATEQCQGPFHLRAQQSERVRHPGLPTGGQAVQRRAADHDAVRTECHGLDHVGAAAETAIDEHAELAAQLGRDRRQQFDAGHARVELPPAVVRQHDAVGTHLGGAPRIFDAQDALQHQLALPAAADVLHVGPDQLRVDLRAHEAHASEGRMCAGRQQFLQVLELRRAARNHHPL